MKNQFTQLSKLSFHTLSIRTHPLLRRFPSVADNFSPIEMQKDQDADRERRGVSLRLKDGQSRLVMLEDLEPLGIGVQKI